MAGHGDGRAGKAETRERPESVHHVEARVREQQPRVALWEPLECTVALRDRSTGPASPFTVARNHQQVRDGPSCGNPKVHCAAGRPQNSIRDENLSHFAR